MVTFLLGCGRLGVVGVGDVGDAALCGN
jgi:hypothetical protein